MMIDKIIGLIVAIALSGNAFAEDWSQFRGADGSGIVSNPELPTSWGGYFEKPFGKRASLGVGGRHRSSLGTAYG